MTGDRKRLQRSTGTRTGFGAARAFFRRPPPAASMEDVEAFRQGEGRFVTCSLRGSVDPYPRRSTQGKLALTSSRVAWRPAWGVRRRWLTIDERIQSMERRPAGGSEWNVKKGGKAFGVLPVPEFQVVVCTTDRGILEFSVPSADLVLVETALGRQ